MFQRLLILIVLGASFAPAVHGAEAKKTSPPAVQIQKKPQKTAEELYLDGLASLKADDAGSAGVALAGINPALPYAKLLRAQIAAASHDFDTPLRLLLPLQAEAGLLPQAYASLHATLALAYEAQENVLGAVEQRIKAEPFLEPQEISANQSRIWKLLAAQPREALVELRGESPDPVMQGWVDLALAIAYAEKKARNIEQWRSAYPDHPASAALLEQLADDADTAQPVDSPVISGKIALLLPLDNPLYATFAQAVQAGVLAALAADSSQPKGVDHAAGHDFAGASKDEQAAILATLAADTGKPEIVTYPTGGAEGVVGIYQRAVADGATFVIGPLTRDEVTQLAGATLTVPVLALNQPDTAIKPQSKLLLFGLPVESEARQIARLARIHGMQSALVVKAATPLAERMAKAFADEWQAQDGTISAQLALPAPEQRADFKLDAAQKAADMIFLAANAAQAQSIRPWLDASIPTYGTSHLYDGMEKNIQNQDLLAVHFVESPWLVEPDNPEFADLRPAVPMASAEQQRLYALGLDAYRLVAALVNAPPVAGRQLLEGATGRIVMQENNVLTRELTPAQFRREGVVPEFAD